MNKVIFRLLSITVIIFLILTGLYVYTDMPNKYNNGFTRTIIAAEIKLLKAQDFVEPLNKIWSVTGNAIYLTGPTPKTILMMKKDFSFKDTITINLSAPEDKLVPFAIAVDTPNLYLHINNLKSVIYGKFPNQSLNLTKLKGSVFTKSVQLSPTSLIIRVFDASAKRQVFRKISTVSNQIIKEAEVVTGQQDDIGMGTDGALHYDNNTAMVSYVEYLRNRFYLLDTNLNVKVAGRTIDTVSSNDVKKQVADEGGGKSKITPGKARVKVNKESFINGHYLYVMSAFRADNESRSNFNRHSVIDRYRLSDGKYSNSFYLDKYKEKLYKSVLASNDTLYVLYSGKLVLYRLPK